MYPHLRTPVPLLVAKEADPKIGLTRNYTRTLSSRAAFDVTTEHEHELLTGEDFMFSDAGVLRPVFDSTYRATAEVLADSPGLFWRMNDSLPYTGVTTAIGKPADSSGNARHGLTFVGSASYDDQWPGPTSDGDTALRMALPGLGAAVLPYHDTYGATAFAGAERTFEGWFYRNENNSSLAMLFGGGGSASPTCYAGGQFGVPVDTVVFRPSNTGALFVWAAALPVATWTHIAVTYVDATDTAILYKNGVSQGAQVSAGTWGATDTFIRVGFWWDGGANSFIWNGAIKDFSVYTSALSAARIAAHYGY